ncbi:MAG: BrnT family toxin [Silvibacterium sp.]|nr:BrnT family toxin [Silvibacterium sp.]
MTRDRLDDSTDRCVGFDWDEWNITKNWVRHRVTPEEAEDIFFHEPRLLLADIGHSRTERRYQVIGETRDGRRLVVVFTVRKNLIRVISARDLNRREHEAYRRDEKENS